MRLSKLLLSVVSIKAVSVARAQAVPFNFEDHGLTVSKSYPIAPFMVNSSPVECMVSTPTSQAMMRSLMVPQTRWPFQQVAELKLVSVTGFPSELLKRNFSPATCPTISADGSAASVLVPV